MKEGREEGRVMVLLAVCCGRLLETGKPIINSSIPLFPASSPSYEVERLRYHSYNALANTIKSPFTCVHVCNVCDHEGGHPHA